MLFLLTACTLAPAALAMKPVQIDYAEVNHEAIEDARKFIQELKANPGDEIPEHGIIIVRAPVLGNLGAAVQDQLYCQLEAPRQVKVSTGPNLLSNNYQQPWEKQFFEKLNLKSLQSYPDKSIIFGALPKGAKHLPLVTAKALLKKKKCWLVVQTLASADKGTRDLFTSSEDHSVITAELSESYVSEEFIINRKEYDHDKQ